MTTYYISRIKKYGVEATRTEVAKGEARIAEINKMVADLESKDSARYGVSGQTPKEIRLEDPSPEWMAKFKSRTEATDDSLARMQKEMREVDDTMARMQKASRESNAETKEARRLVDEARRQESLARDTKTANMGIRQPERVPPVQPQGLRRPLTSDLELHPQTVDIMRSKPSSLEGI